MKALKKIYLPLLLTSFFSFTNLNAQQWGDYTLYSIKNSSNAYLIDTNNATYHTWTGLSPSTAYSSYLLPGGTLLRTVNHPGNSFSGGAMTGEFQKVSYSGTLLWDFVYSTSAYCMHHDICPMPNGNVLVIAYESKTGPQTTQAGCSSAITMWPDKIVEIQQTGPTTGTVVWEWHLWDHLCQSFNAAKDNYVSSTAAHPELYNINLNPQKEVWHTNGLDYNPVLDQIIMSSHMNNEAYIIDHSTTIAEAASHSGGLSGKGGDFLYRWGNPTAYGQTGTTIFNVVHDAHWIPEGYVNEGRIVGFNNNGISMSQSCVDQITPPVSGYNYSYTANTAYAPSTYTSRLSCTGYTSNEGNSQQLPNGNQLVCIAFSGLIYEVDPAGTTIWSKSITGQVSQAFRYSACYVNNTAPAIPTITQNVSVLTSSAATTYQWYLNGVQIVGATSQNYTPSVSGIYLVRVTDANGCMFSYSANFNFSFTTSVLSIFNNQNELTIFPNPSTGIVTIETGLNENKNYVVTVLDAMGKNIITAENSKTLDLSNLENGIYFISVISENQTSVTKKISIIK